MFDPLTEAEAADLRATLERQYDRAHEALARMDLAGFLEAASPAGLTLNPLEARSLLLSLAAQYPPRTEFAFVRVARRGDAAGYYATTGSSPRRLRMIRFTQVREAWLMFGGDAEISMAEDADPVSLVESERDFLLEPPHWEKCLDLSLFDRPRDPRPPFGGQFDLGLFWPEEKPKFPWTR